MDADQQNILDPWTDSGFFFVYEKLRTPPPDAYRRWSYSWFPSNLYFYYQASKHEKRVILAYFTQNNVFFFCDYAAAADGIVRIIILDWIEDIVDTELLWIQA